MDGVLADFNLQAQKVLSASDQDVSIAAQRGRWCPQQWEKLRSNPRFYLDLPKTEIADSLVAVALQLVRQRNYQLAVLTAIPKNNDMPWAFWDKFLWMQQRYPDIPLHFGPYSHDKASHCTPGDILVDDRRDNCQQWQARGGIAIRVLDSEPQKAVEELAKLL